MNLTVSIARISGCKKNAIYRFKEFMFSTYVAKRICACRLYGIDVRQRFLRMPVMRKNSWHDSYFMQRRNVLESFLQCTQTVISGRSVAYLMLNVYLRTTHQRITSFPFKRELLSGEMHVIMHATNEA